MITLFTIPKPFEGHYEIIQKNAIISWMLLEPKCEIIVFSDDLSTEKICNEYQIRYLRDFKNNSYGTPLLDGIWKKVKEVANNDLICYTSLVNNYLRHSNIPIFIQNGFCLAKI